MRAGIVAIKLRGRVAGARNHPNLLVLPFTLELIRPAAQPIRRLDIPTRFLVGEDTKAIA